MSESKLDTTLPVVLFILGALGIAIVFLPWFKIDLSGLINIEEAPTITGEKTKIGYYILAIFLLQIIISFIRDAQYRILYYLPSILAFLLMTGFLVWLKIKGNEIPEETLAFFNSEPPSIGYAFGIGLEYAVITFSFFIGQKMARLSREEIFEEEDFWQAVNLPSSGANNSISTDSDSTSSFLTAGEGGTSTATDISERPHIGSGRIIAGGRADASERPYRGSGRIIAGGRADASYTRAGSTTSDDSGTSDGTYTSKSSEKTPGNSNDSDGKPIQSTESAVQSAFNYEQFLASQRNSRTRMFILGSLIGLLIALSAILIYIIANNARKSDSPAAKVQNERTRLDSLVTHVNYLMADSRYADAISELDSLEWKINPPEYPQEVQKYEQIRLDLHNTLTKLQGEIAAPQPVAPPPVVIDAGPPEYLAVDTYLRAITIVKRAYFYSKPSLNFQRDRYVVLGQVITITKILCDFYYASYTWQGRTTTGWMYKDNFTTNFYEDGRDYHDPEESYDEEWLQQVR